MNYVKKRFKTFDVAMDKGKSFKLSLCGMHAMDIMRMESGYLHWGHDISPEENQFEAGLNFAVSFKKNINFIEELLWKKNVTKRTARNLKCSFEPF